MTTSNQLTVYDKLKEPMTAIKQIGSTIAKSRIFQCESEAQGEILALTCLHRQCDPLTLAETYDIIQGRLSMKSDAMLAGFAAEGGEWDIHQYDSEAADVTFKIRGKSLRVAITWEQAKQEKWPYGKDKKLKDNWASPIGRQDMLWARVVSRAVRRLAPSVVCGRYTPEEISDFSDSGDVSSAVVSTAPAAPSANASVVEPQAAVTAESDVVDAEYSVTVPAEESAETLQHVDVVAEAMSQNINEPATNDHRERIVELMRELAQLGEDDIAERLKQKLAASGISKITDMTVSEAEALIAAMEVKETKRFFDLSIEGYESKKRTAGNA